MTLDSEAPRKLEQKWNIRGHMMGRRGRVRTEKPRDPAAVLRALRACRDALTREVDMHVTPFGLTYRLSAAIRAAIDALADRLTGRPDYFHEPGGGATEGQTADRQALLARERGETPWNVELDPPRPPRRKIG